MIQTLLVSFRFYLDGSFFTTLVSKPTFSQIWSNYTSLKNDYDSLLANYSSLFANYTSLEIEHNQLTTDYNNKVAAYSLLLSQYDKLSNDNNPLYDNYASQKTCGDIGVDFMTTIADLGLSKETIVEILVSALSHATYFRSELAKVKIALKNGKDYFQDRPLFKK